MDELIQQEITAAAKILDMDHEEKFQGEHQEWEREFPKYMESWHAPLVFSPPKEPKAPTSKDIAKLALEAAEAARQKAALWVTVARIMLPNGQWHNFACGPYSTLLRAQAAGEAFTHDPKSKTGEGGFRAVPLVQNARQAYDAIRPEHKDEKAWIKEQIQAGMSGLDWSERSLW